MLSDIEITLTLVLACPLEVEVAGISSAGSNHLRCDPLRRSPQAAWRRPEFHRDLHRRQ